jgi:hypothetical protein
MAALLDNYFHSFCHSHTLAKVGTHCHAKLVNDFVSAVGAVFKNSPAARAVFSRLTGEEVKRKHKVRWFTTTDVVLQAMRVATKWPQIVVEIQNENACKDSLPKLKKILDENKRPYDDLWLEMNAVYDGTVLFYKAATFFEGTSFLAPFVWRYLRTLRLFAEKVLKAAEPDTILPNVAAIMRNLPDQVPPRPVWGKARQTIDPGLEYFMKHFVRLEKSSKARQFQMANDIFGFARIFHPTYALDWIAGKDGTEKFHLAHELSKAPVLNVLLVLGVNIVQELTADFGRYLTCLEQRLDKGRKYGCDVVLEWWRTNGSHAGSWAAAARLFTLLQPSSASAERVFSVLRASTSEQQDLMLQDQQELRIRMRFSMKKSDADAE